MSTENDTYKLAAIMEADVTIAQRPLNRIKSSEMHRPKSGRGGKMRKIKKTWAGFSARWIHLVFLMILLIPMYAIADDGGQLRLNGIYQTDNDGGVWVYMRFYPNGKAARINIGVDCNHRLVTRELPENYQMKRWIGLSGHTGDFGDYVVDGSRISYTATYVGRHQYQPITFNGVIGKDTITFKWIDPKKNEEVEEIYWFLQGPPFVQRPEPLAQKKKNQQLALERKNKELEKIEEKLKKEKKDRELASKQKSSGIPTSKNALATADSPKAPSKSNKGLIAKKTETFTPKKGDVTQVKNYDSYGLYHEIFLFNKNAEVIARKIILRSQYNPTQITGILIKDQSGRQIHFSEIEPGGNIKDHRWICLDQDGNMVKKNGIPVIVKFFQAKQVSKFEIKYDGAFKDKEITTFSSCSNCAEATGIKDCAYVW